MIACNHDYKYSITNFGMVDYGGPIVYGCHNQYKCTNCGKLRWRIQKGYKVLITRKENNKHYQLQLF